MRTQQVHDDELFRCRVGQYFFKWRQHIAVIFARTLRTLLIHIELLIRLLREHGQHGVASRHRLLIGDPEGFITCLFHHIHQRRLSQVQVRILLVGEGQRLLQDFNGVRT